MNFNTENPDIDASNFENQNCTQYLNRPDTSGEKVHAFFGLLQSVRF